MKRKKKNIDKDILKLWAIEVKKRAGDKCELCGREEGAIHAHHFWGRKNKATRYLISNGIALCFMHHTGGVESAHESPKWFIDKMINIRGKNWLNKLSSEWIKIKKYNENDLLEILNRFKSGQFNIEDV